MTEPNQLDALRNRVEQLESALFAVIVIVKTDFKAVAKLKNQFPSQFLVLADFIETHTERSAL